MSLQGHIQNGVVVFNAPISLPDRTAVRVEPLAPASVKFWTGASLDELARRQGVRAAAVDEDCGAGWPADELDDGCKDAVVGESRSTGRPMTFGETATGKRIGVVREQELDNPRVIRPVTAFEVD